MVSTRSSARKPPNPTRPRSATSVATPVVDDPPPPYPRRSPRIRIKNGEKLPLQFISLTPSSTTITGPVASDRVMPQMQQTHLDNQLPLSDAVSPDKTPRAIEEVQDEPSRDREHMKTADARIGDRSHVLVDTSPEDALQREEEKTAPISEKETEYERDRHKIDANGCTAVPVVEQQERSPMLNHLEADSKDDVPEEINAVDAKRMVDVSGRAERIARIAVQTEIKKRRRRRRKWMNMGPPQSNEVHYEATEQHNTDRNALVAERLSDDAITAAQVAVQDAKTRKLAATRTARQRKQVKRVGERNRPQRVGDTEVIVVANAYPPIGGLPKKRGNSAASFLTTCVRNGPKRVPSSKIAMIAASARSLRA